MEDLLAHELAHSCLPLSEHHGPAWKDMYLAILSEGYGLDIPWPGSEKGYRSTGYGYDYAKAVQCIETQLRQHLTKNCAPRSLRPKFLRRLGKRSGVAAISGKSRGGGIRTPECQDQNLEA